MQPTQSFTNLTPDTIIDAVESIGFVSDGRQFPLNSYENRVIQVGIEGGEPIIAKFYRPNRWSDDAIIEEHHFCLELAAAELPVVPPLAINNQTLHRWNGLRFALFTRKGGRAPELDNLNHLYSLGLTLGQMHQVAIKEPFQYRPTLDIETFGFNAQKTVLQTLLPKNLRPAYESITNELLKLLGPVFANRHVTYVRSHGDCHPGNILWRDDKPHFVDFDDARMAPAVQDIWMMLSGDRSQQQSQLREIIEGYETFSTFDRKEIRWIEPLRTLRIMHHCSWLAKRWDDPAFPHNFPWFNTDRYWGEHILELKEQLSALQYPIYDDDFLKI